MSLVKKITLLITIIALNVLSWYFVLSQFLLLLGFYTDSEIIFFGQLLTTAVSIVAWIWVHYAPEKELREARRYEA